PLRTCRGQDPSRAKRTGDDAAMSPTEVPRLRGQLDEHVLVSVALRGNPLGDPHERPLWVYTPPSYAGGPIVYVLQGFTGQLEMWRNRAAFRPTFLELLDDADIDARVVFVDAWTSVGGSQFVDSAGSGRY